MRRTELADAIAVLCMILGFGFLAVDFVFVLFRVANNSALWIGGFCMWAVGFGYLMFSEDPDESTRKN